MNKIITIILIIAVIFSIGYVIYFLRPFGFERPKNYDECVQVGGRTNKNEMRVQDTCRYNGKVFNGNIF